jgi:Predicted DNA-binding proteins
MNKCRGRPKCPRRVEQTPDITYFKPRGVPLSDLEVVSITVEELEALRLVDVEDLKQEDAAIKVGISRRAFWEDLKAARTKIALALTTGKAIEIKGGNYISAEGGDISEDADT